MNSLPHSTATFRKFAEQFSYIESELEPHLWSLEELHPSCNLLIWNETASVTWHNHVLAEIPTTERCRFQFDRESLYLGVTNYRIKSNSSSSLPELTTTFRFTLPRYQCVWLWQPFLRKHLSYYHKCLAGLSDSSTPRQHLEHLNASQTVINLIKTGQTHYYAVGQTKIL